MSGRVFPMEKRIASSAIKIKAFLLSGMLFLCLVDMGSASREFPGAQGAKVKIDVLPVYCQPTPTSGIVKTLHRGDRLVILHEMAMPEGRWCRIREEGFPDYSGYVLCRNLNYSREETSSNLPLAGERSPNSQVSYAAEANGPFTLSGPEKSSDPPLSPGAFLQALWEGDAARVGEMLEAGMDPNMSTKLGGRPLIISAKKTNPEILKLLIAKGANLESRDPNETTPLIAAAAAGLEKNLEILITAGADLNARDITGLTALSWASIKGFPKVVELLIARGADVGARSKDGKTALRLSKMILANTQKSLSSASSEDSPEALQRLKVKLDKQEKVVQILEKAGGTE